MSRSVEDPQLSYECDRERERAEMLGALKALAELCKHVPVFQLDDGKSSVVAVRRAGKFVAALNHAKAVIAKAEGK